MSDLKLSNLSKDQLIQSLKNIILEERWISSSVSKYSKSNLEELDELIQKISTFDFGLESIKDMCVEYLNADSKNKNNIVALYITSMVMYQLDIMNQVYIESLIDIFKESSNIEVLSYINNKIISYDASNYYILLALSDLYKESDSTKYLESLLSLSKIDYNNGIHSYKLYQLYNENGNTELALKYLKITVSRYSKVINSKVLPILSKLWSTLCKDNFKDIEFICNVYVEIFRKFPETLESYIGNVINKFKEIEDYDNLFIFLKKIFVITLANSNSFLYEELLLCLDKLYSDSINYDFYLKNSGFKKNNLNITDSIMRFEKYTSFNKGVYVYHRSWGVGVVSEINRDLISIDFGTRLSHKMSFKIALSSLKILQDDHLWVRKFTDFEELKKDIFNDNKIVEILKITFNSFADGLTVKDIKKYLIDLVGDDKEWVKWWLKAKKNMKSNPMFGNEVNKRNTYFLRSKPLSFEEEIINNFNSVDSFYHKVEFFFTYTKEGKNIDQESFNNLLKYFVNIVNNRTSSDHGIDLTVVVSFFILNLVRRKKLVNNNFNPIIDSIVANGFFHLNISHRHIIGNMDIVLESYLMVKSVEYKYNIIEFLSKHHKDLFNVLEKMFYKTFDDIVNTKIINLLVATDKKASINLMQSILANGYRNSIEIYFWLVKTCLLTPNFLNKLGVKITDILPQDEPKYSYKNIIFGLFRCLDLLNKDSNSRDVDKVRYNKKLMKLIAEFLLIEVDMDGKTDYDSEDVSINSIFIQYLMKNSEKRVDSVHIKRILALVNSYSNLSKKLRTQFISIINTKFPLLLVEKTNNQNKLHDLMVSRLSYQKRCNELKRILELEIPENTKAISIAKSKGDLKENADYIAAVEHHKNLQQKASVLSRDIRNCRVINIDDVDNSCIKPGTIATLLEMGSNKKLDYIILGEWDTDVEHNIISYRSPFGMQLVGKELNDEVNFEFNGFIKVYKVLAIKKATRFILRAL